MLQGNCSTGSTWRHSESFRDESIIYNSTGALHIRERKRKWKTRDLVGEEEEEEEKEEEGTLLPWKRAHVLSCKIPFFRSLARHARRFYPTLSCRARGIVDRRQRVKKKVNKRERERERNGEGRVDRA